MVRDALQRGWQVLCTDLESAADPSKVRAWRNQGIPVVLGDLRDADFVKRIIHDEVSQLSVIVHLAAVSPPDSEHNDKLSYESNVIATARLLRAAKKLRQSPFFIFTSTHNVYGVPLSNHSTKFTDDALAPAGNYGKHKAEAEALVQAAGIPWSIARISTVLDANSTNRANRSMMNMAFEMSPDLPSECIHTSDTVQALCNMADRQADCAGKVLLIAGGASCRVTHFDLMNMYFEAVGLRLDASTFGGDRYPCHWLDTQESERLLSYQKHSYKDICRQANTRFRRVRPFLRPLSFVISPMIAWYIRRFIRQTSWL